MPTRITPISLVGALLLFGALGAFWLTGCAATTAGDVFETTGQGIRPAWGPAVTSRLKAREEALREARLKIWDELMRERTTGDLTFEQLVIVSPVFESKLRGMVAGLRPKEIKEGPGGLLTVSLSIDKSKAHSLARRYVPK